MVIKDKNLQGEERNMKKIVYLTMLMLFINSNLFAGNIREIYYDDGISDLWVSPYSYNKGSEIAVRFSANPYPVKIERVSVYIPNSGNPTSYFMIKVYTINNDYSPGIQLDAWNIWAHATRGGEWVNIDVSQYELIVNKDFYVGVYWNTPPGPNGNNAQKIGLDKTYPVENRAYWKWGSSDNWHKCNSNQSCYGDPLIRIAVSPLSGGMPAEVDSNLFIHIPSAIYHNTDLWADFEYVGTDQNGYHLWRLKAYGPNF